MRGSGSVTDRAERMRLLREERSAERAKVRSEVFDFHRRGLPCPYGSCCAEEREGLVRSTVV